MLDGTKKIFPTEYEKFVETTVFAAEEDQLPIAFQCDEEFIKDITAQDVHDLIYEYHRDSGLDLTATYFMCNHCKKLHLLFEVNYPEEEDNTLLQ